MNELLKPGTKIKPAFSIESAKKLAEDLYGIMIESIKEIQAYDDRNYYLTVSLCNNKNIQKWPHGYILKILNSFGSRKVHYVEAQIEFMFFLGKNGIRCTQPIKNLEGSYFSSVKNKTEQREETHLVRLLAFQPGDILFSTPLTQDLCLETGDYLAKMNIALEKFAHPALNNHTSVWALHCIQYLFSFIFALKEESQKELVTNIINEFQATVMPIKDELPQGVIHGDFNDHNTLIQKSNLDNQYHVDGVIDFGDIQYSCYLFEIALAACYNMLLAKPPLNPEYAAALTIAGYHKLKPLSEQEIKLLKICICARICQSLVLGAYTHLQDPDNEYVLRTSNFGNPWALLEKFWSKPDKEFEDLLKCTFY